MTITITAENDPPVAANVDLAAVLEHGPATVVTASYTDPDVGDTHSFAIDTDRHQGQGDQQRRRHLQLRSERRVCEPEGRCDRDRQVHAIR